jgi:hypothetical protein
MLSIGCRHLDLEYQERGYSTKQPLLRCVNEIFVDFDWCSSHREQPRDNHSIWFFFSSSIWLMMLVINLTVPHHD